MKSTPIFRALLVTGTLAALPSFANAQQQAVPQVPQVVTTSRGEVDVKPDRAHIQFSVETRASTAAAAAADNSRRQRAVLDTLQKLGITVDQMQTSNLQVTPEMVYPGQGLPPKVSGYVARNSVRVDVMKLEQTGTLIDAGLAKGSTGIGGLNFYSSRAVEAHREALARAVTAARLDAEAMAKAAGLQLGGLLEITAYPSNDMPMADYAQARGMKLAAAMEPTPVNPGEIKISETVMVRWAVVKP
ncbi:MAG: SIMPL domain-containing protein [Gemmatimonadaceae bacterium]